VTTVQAGRVFAGDSAIRGVAAHERSMWQATCTAARATKENAMAGKSGRKDLPAKKDVKGGKSTKLATNDNLTLVRAAKPAKKDLPAGKDVKGGKKAR
jgi:hypothetical protein